MHIFDDTWPEFMRLLDSNPRRAQLLFWDLHVRYLRSSPPRLITSLSATERDDLEAAVFLYCVQDDFRVLRQYTDQGYAFVRWLSRVVCTQALQRIRKTGREISQPIEHIEHIAHSPGQSDNSADNGATSPADTWLNLIAVKKHFARLGAKCQLLLKLSAEEYLPREMALILGLPKEDGKKVSNDLRYCRLRLLQYLNEEVSKV